MPQFTSEILNAAILGFEAQKVRIDAQIAEIRQLLNDQPTEASPPPQGAAPKRHVSAAARARMALGQRKRWAAAKSETVATSAEAEPEKPKRKLSEAGRANIIAALKKRWATKKSGPKKKAAAKRKSAVKKSAVKGTAEPAA